MRELHPLQRRWKAEELVRLRRSDERRRYVAPQRAGRIDANPHQIDAVVFALSRLNEGGCILADEVGLGKTIEAGLVMAQRLSEDATRVLLVTPKPLLGQWRQELFDLFGIEAHEGCLDPDALSQPGVYLMGRELASSSKGKAALLEVPAMDLVVVDEAHELFSGLHRRFRGLGEYNPDTKEAQMAGRLYELLRHWDSPVLLLTATPLQNALTELWSLVQYVDRTSTLLGQLPTFRELFCAGQGDRSVREGQEDELRHRLQSVLKRTLRRQAQPFLEKPFVDRQARTFEYSMSPEEQRLYDDVTNYLLERNIVAFRGQQRRLLLLGFHRRMASSKLALAASLDKVAERLRKELAGDSKTPAAGPQLDPDVHEFFADLEADPEDERAKSPDSVDEAARPSPEAIRAELERVEGFARRARSMGQDAKLQALLRAVHLVREEASKGTISGKMVIFTESLSTQTYLHNALLGSGLFQDHDITLFRGNNEGPRAAQALERWRAETQQDVPRGLQPSRDIAVRAALVHEFKTRSQIFISTEAGAKGLNLQFCETLVNYDLPWNPQRIEQRIGRCHRYGQRNAVTVMNFISAQNEAEQLTFQILSRKLELFGTVLDATDQVLHAAGQTPAEALVTALGPELEAEIRRIHEQARTRDEIVAEMRDLENRFDEKRKSFESEHRRTASIIESAFDEDVQRVFRGHREEVGPELANLDRDMEEVLLAYLQARDIPFARDDSRIYSVAPHAALPEGLREGLRFSIGSHSTAPSLHLGHPLLRAAVEDARHAMQSVDAIRIGGVESPELAPYRGQRGRACLLWVRYSGLETVDEFLPIVVMAGSDEALPHEHARALFECSFTTIPSEGGTVDDPSFDDAIEERLFRHGQVVDAHERPRHRRKIDQLERYMDDRALILRRRLSALSARLDRVAEERDAALTREARSSAQAKLEKLEEEVNDLESQLEEIQDRDDVLYQRLRSRGMDRRYMPPTPSRLFDVQVEIQ